MANTKIDPAFQAAPFFGESSYDPIRAVQQIKDEEYNRNLLKQKKQQEDMDKGLKELSMDIKSWEDQKGFEEISNELETLRAKYVEIGNQGLNLARPTNIAEQKLSKAFHTALNNLKHKHDVWQFQKQRVDAAQKVIDDQIQKPEEERDIDTQAVYSNVKKLKETEGILNRSDITGNLLVNKARPVDVGEYVRSNFAKQIPGMDKWVKSWSWDPITNKFSKLTGEGIKPARLLSGMGKLLSTAPVNIQNAVDKEYKLAKAENPQMLESKEEWFAKRYSPETPVREERTMTGGGGGTGAGAGGGFGVPQKDASGNYPLEPQIREMHFDTKDATATDKVYPYESVGRVPVGSVFGFKPISVIGSVNNINTVTGKREAKGLAVPATPVELNMLPVAQEEIQIDVQDPKTLKIVKEVIPKGEKIPKHVLEAIRQLNQQSRDNGRPPAYKVGYEKFVTLGLNYKQKREGKEAPEGISQDLANIYMTDATGRTVSYTETSIVPYDEVRKDLFAAAKENKQDWKPFDDYIQSMYNQLNSTDRISNLFEVKGKTVDELYKGLEE